MRIIGLSDSDERDRETIVWVQWAVHILVLDLSIVH